MFKFSGTLLKSRSRWDLILRSSPLVPPPSGGLITAQKPLFCFTLRYLLPGYQHNIDEPDRSLARYRDHHLAQMFHAAVNPPPTGRHDGRRCTCNRNSSVQPYIRKTCTFQCRRAGPRLRLRRARGESRLSCTNQIDPFFFHPCGPLANAATHLARS